MAIKNYIEFQISEYAAQLEFLNEIIRSQGEPHRVLDLAKSYLSEINKENSSVRPIGKIDYIIEAKKTFSSEETFITSFGKSIANILFNLDDFDRDFPKFIKAYHILFFGDAKYRELHKQFNYGDYVFLDETTPFLASEVVLDKIKNVDFKPSSFERLNHLFIASSRTFNRSIDQYNHREFFNFFLSESKKFAACFADDSLFYMPMPVNFNYTGFLDLPNALVSYEYQKTFGYADTVYDRSTENNYDIPDVDDYYVKEAKAQEDLKGISLNDYESVKYKKMFGIDQSTFLRNESVLLNLIQLKQNVLSTTKGEMYDAAKVPADVIIAFDELQTQQIVVDAHAFAMILMQVTNFNKPEKLGFCADEDYLYIITDHSVTRNENIKRIVPIDGVDTEVIVPQTTTRRLFGRVKIKNSNYAKLSHYIWLYKYDASITLRDILKSVTEEDLTTINIPTDFLNQKQILTGKQRSLIEKVEDKLTTSGKEGSEFLEELKKIAEKFILTYAIKTAGGGYEPKPNNVGMMFGEGMENKDYIYKVNEIFWRNNKNISIEELIAYFIAKGDDYNFRLLSYRILGFDAFLHKDKVLIPLLQKSLLCIEEFSINVATKEIVKPIKLAYKYEYVTGNYFDRAKSVRIGITEDQIEKLEREDVKDLYDSCVAYFGKELGELIVSNQVDWLNANKPTQMTLDGNEVDGNQLTPTLYDPKIFEAIDDIAKSFFLSTTYSPIDESITRADFETLYKMRAKAGDYIVRHFSVNLFYDIRIIEKVIDRKKTRVYCVFGKGNNAIIYEGQGANSESDCKEWATDNLNGGKLTFSDISKALKDKTGVKLVPDYPKFRKAGIVGISVINKKYVTGEYAESDYKYAQFYSMFNMKTYRMLHDTGFISDKTWDEIKDRQTLIKGDDLWKIVEPLLKKSDDDDDDEDNVEGEEKVGSRKDIQVWLNAAKDLLVALPDHECKVIFDMVIQEFNLLYSKTIKEGDLQFARYLRGNQSHARKYEYIWNYRYNSNMHPFVEKQIQFYDDNNKSFTKFERLFDNSKFPIFLEHSKFFGDKVDAELSLQDSQIDGVKYYTSNKNSALLAHEVGFGKALEINALVLTPTGWKRNGDIKVGDEVIAVDGKPTRVCGVYPQGEKDLYRITFNDGASVECCEEHLWTVTDTTRKSRGDDWLVLTTKQLMDESLELPIRGKRGNAVHRNYKYKTYYKEPVNGELRDKWHIPVVAPVHFEERPLPIDPYLLGSLIGDGCLTESVGFSTADEETVYRINSILKDGLRLKETAKYAYQIGRAQVAGIGNRTNELFGAIKELGLNKNAWHKFIPDIYKFNSVENRILLLQGLMDTDGTSKPVRGRNSAALSYCTTSKQLCDDFIFLIRSLGGIATIYEKHPTFTYRGEKKDGRLAYVINVNLPTDIIPFLLTRKIAKHTPKYKYTPSRLISNIEYVGKKEAQCIAVEHPDHLYVTEDFIVTHNTIASICCIFHSLITGQAKRPFISAPAQVYKNFGKEISGEQGSFRGLIPHIPLLKLLNAKPRVFLKYNRQLEQVGGIKKYSKNQIKIIDDFNKVKKVKKDIISDKYNKKIALSAGQENSFENFIKEFEKFLDKNVPLWKTEPNFKEITLDKFNDMHKRLQDQYNESVQEDRDAYNAKVDALVEGKNKGFNQISNKEWSKFNGERGIYKGKSKSEGQEIYDQRVEKLKEAYSKKMLAAFNKILLKKEDRFAKRLAKYIVTSIAVLAKKIYDALGYYGDEFMRDRAIVISSHTAIPDFEIEYDDAWDACKELGLKPERADLLSNKPVSFQKLDCDMIVIDEIHNFNEYYSKSQRINISYKTDKKNGLQLVCDYGTREGNMNGFLGVVKYETKGIQTKETKIILSRILRANFKKNLAERGVSNNIIMSATPFVDNLYQMISVFNMLKPSMSVVDFYSNCCYENWTYGVGSKGEVKYEAQISSFKNKIARNNYIKSNCQFYTYDPQIEKRRPNKFIFPYVGDEVNAIRWKCYTEASSAIPLSEPQLHLVKNIGKFLYGEIDIDDIAPLKEPASTLKKMPLIDFKDQIEIFKDIAAGGEIDQVEDFIRDNELLSYSKKDEGYDSLKELLSILEEQADASNYILFYKKDASTNDEDDESEDQVSEVEANSIRNAGAKLSFSSVKQQRVCLSPYMVGYQTADGEKGGMENAMLPSLMGNSAEVIKESAKIFVENSPKILFAINAVLQTIDYHKKRNEDISGQIMFISKGENFRYGGIMYNAHKLITEYLMNYGGLNKEHIISVYDEENEEDVEIKVKEVETLVGSTQVLKKKAIENGFNQGLIKVIIGSESIREGINLQGINKPNKKHGTSTIYILTPDYSPMTFLQLEGRGWRQGNPLDNIRVVYILHKNSVDQHVYSRLKTKILQVKSLLEAGIYESNSTQFQQDIEGVAEFLTTDIEKKIDVRWRGKRTELESKIKEFNQKGEKIDYLKMNYGEAKRYLSTVIPFINDYGRFVQMVDIVWAINETPYALTERKEIIDVKNKLKDVEAKYNVEIKEKVDAPVNEEFEKIMAAWKARKAEHNEKIKELKEKEKARIQDLKDKAKAAEDKVKAAKKLIEAGAKELTGLGSTKSLEELELDAKLAVIGISNAPMTFPEFPEPEPTNKEKNELKQKYVSIILEINDRRRVELAAVYRKGCEYILNLCSDPASGVEFCRVNDIYYRKEISSGSTSYEISNQVKALLDNYRFKSSSPIEDSSDSIGFNNYRYIQSTDKFESKSGIGKEYSARLDFAYFYDIANRKPYYTKDEELIDKVFFADFYYSKFMTLNNQYLTLLKNGEYKDRSKTISLKIWGLANTGKNVIYQLISGQYVSELLSNYENLVLAEGKDMTTVDELIVANQTQKEVELNKLLQEADFKDGLRTNYIAQEKKLAEERKKLTSLIEFVNFEVEKFSISNKMLYFRDIENLNEVRKELAEEV